MKHVTIIIPQGEYSLVNVAGTHQILNAVNGLLAQIGKPPLFRISLAGINQPKGDSQSIFQAKPDCLIHDINKADLVIIPAIFGSYDAVLEQNKDLLPWLIQQHRQGAELVSFCIGAFVLASTGLLDGKICATHWAHAAEFRRMFPEVLLVDEKIITSSEGIYTSGGAYAYLNLLLYLVEKFAGRQIAITISKMFMIDIDKVSQSPFIIFEGQKNHGDELVREAQEIIETNYPEKLTVEDLASNLALGRRSLERRFKKATANTIIEYIQRVKVEVAKKNLESTGKNINEVMFEVGYNDEKAFRSIFKRITGISPLEYKRKYNGDLVRA
jgi:transcriptional regulator GlxA family with amidase domain